VVEALDEAALESCWADDMTLGWIYQYWNDPEREALDAKLNSGGKVEPHEIASKTQMFTERYMVDWLLQNSLGSMWPEAESNRTLEALEVRRTDWRAKREAGKVELTDLMPLHTDAEHRWAYYVPQPIPDDAVKNAPDSVRDMKILDPAVGSGHFLVVALDLLVHFYREESRHRREELDQKWSDQAIVERILEYNLHGIDLDPRAVQIAAAALWLKARQTCPEAHLRQLNLVASNLRLSSLPENSPGLLELQREVERETGIPAALTVTVVHALQGADHLGSLLKVDRAVEDAIAEHEKAVAVRKELTQADFLLNEAQQQPEIDFEATAARRSLVERLEGFLNRHTSGDDLGLRLHGEQLAAGVRLVRILQEDAYDLVVANPPYQGTSKLIDATYIAHRYPLGRSNLYTAFLTRGLDLVRAGGVSAMLTMRNWMFLKQHVALRHDVLERFDFRAIGDFDRGAFEDVPDELVSVAVSVIRKAFHTGKSVAVCPTPREDISRDSKRTQRKRAATLCQSGRCEFNQMHLKAVSGWPVAYWWSKHNINEYCFTPKIGDFGGCTEGLGTRDDKRFLRRPWETTRLEMHIVQYPGDRRKGNWKWMPFIKGAEGKRWLEPLDFVINWDWWGAEIACAASSRYGRGAQLYFHQGIAVATMGQRFSARQHRFVSIFGDAGVSVFTDRQESALCSMNGAKGEQTLQSLNPSNSFKVNDINRLPLFEMEDAMEIVETLWSAFASHESHREPSVEFRNPGPSPWLHAQTWAQQAVDRPEGEALPAYVERLASEQPADHLSYALGVALGRFSPKGEGPLDPGHVDISRAVSAGIIFLDGTLDASDHRDSLGHPVIHVVHTAWATHGSAIATATDLRTWLRLKFFQDVHKGMYENRPIHWPLSSEKRTFVAWVNIHRWTEQTLRVLLADHLVPTLTRLDGELNDLRATRDGTNRKAARDAEKCYAVVLKARDELATFISAVEQCADKGPPPTHSDPKKCPPREVDAQYAPDLDDGVVINSAALWPLLEPQWKDPKKWWTELALANGRKDYDWAHLAMRYWPTRVDVKCQKDPSLGVAHGCFWIYHPARAWAWELRLQDEIAPDFRIEEAPYRGDGDDAEHRTTYLRDHPEEALQAVEKEALRRRGRGKDARPIPEMRILEPGLWSVCPDECWTLELSVSEKQGEEFRLLAPDEPDARAAFEAAHPDRVEARKKILAELVPADLFDETEESDANTVQEST
jgi:hypothetical protein